MADRPRDEEDGEDHFDHLNDESYLFPDWKNPGGSSPMEPTK